MRAWVGRLLRGVANRVDDAGAPKVTHLSFTFEPFEGIRFRDDRRGCPVAYLGESDFARAHDEAGPLGPQSEQAVDVSRVELAESTARAMNEGYDLGFGAGRADAERWEESSANWQELYRNAGEALREIANMAQDARRSAGGSYTAQVDVSSIVRAIEKAGLL